MHSSTLTFIKSGKFLNRFFTVSRAQKSLNVDSFLLQSQIACRKCHKIANLIRTSAKVAIFKNIKLYIAGCDKFDRQHLTCVRKKNF